MAGFFKEKQICGKGKAHHGRGVEFDHILKCGSFGIGSRFLLDPNGRSTSSNGFSDMDLAIMAEGAVFAQSSILLHQLCTVMFDVLT